MVMSSALSSSLMWKLRKTRSWQRRPKSLLRRLFADKVRRRLSSFLLLSTLSLGPLMRALAIRPSSRMSSRRERQLKEIFSASASTTAAVLFLLAYLLAFFKCSCALIRSSYVIYSSSSSNDELGSCGARVLVLASLIGIVSLTRRWSPTWISSLGSSRRWPS